MRASFPPKVPTSVLHAAEEAATRITQSDVTLHLAGEYVAASSFVFRERVLDIDAELYLPLSQWHLQVPQAPSRQSSGMLILAR